MKRKRILVIDDDPDLRTAVEMRFSAAGFEVLPAAGGEEGLELARRKQPAAIILDINMPGLDGLETCRRLRAGERTRNIPVVMLTARTRVGELEEGLQAGADTYLTKPFDGPELLAEVKQLIGGGASGKSAAPRPGGTGSAAASRAVAKLAAASRRLGEVARAVPGLSLIHI